MKSVVVLPCKIWAFNCKTNHKTVFITIKVDTFYGPQCTE